MSNTKKQFWASPTRNSIYQRWTMLVLLNAALPFLLSLTAISGPSALIGITLAIVSFLVIYAELESWLLLNRHTQLAKQLKLAALIKIATIIVPFIDMFIGACAMEASESLTGINLGASSFDSTFINLPILAASYITTMIDGFLLSILVAILMMIIKGITRLRQFKKGTHEPCLKT